MTSLTSGGNTYTAKRSNASIATRRVASPARAKEVGHARLRALLLITLIIILSPASNGASLEPATAKAWKEYIESADIRLKQSLSPGQCFLWVAKEPSRLAKVQNGEIVVSPVSPQEPKRVPSGLIHDWVGATFIAHVTLGDVLQTVRNYSRYKDWYKPTVINSSVIDIGDAKDRFSMLLLNKSLFLRTALDADYESSFVRLDNRMAYSVSWTTRIQEIQAYGTSTQRILPENHGDGFLWKLFSITRYVERDGGVYLELEAIGLSRDIPASLRWLVEPIVRRVSRTSLEISLRQTANAVRLRPELAHGKMRNEGSMAATDREDSFQ